MKTQLENRLHVCLRMCVAFYLRPTLLPFQALVTSATPLSIGQPLLLAKTKACWPFEEMNNYSCTMALKKH